MIEILKGYPDDVLAISGTGRITGNDYRNVVLPEAETRIGRHGSMRILYYIGPKYQGFSSSAIWSDMVFGLANWSKFGRVALVTDVEWIRASARFFMPFFRRRAFRIFGAAELPAASAWIRGAEDAG